MHRAWSAYAALDRRIWTLTIVRAINTMGLSLVMTFMAIYLVTERGITGQLYGAIYFVANMCQSLAQGYAGELSDRFGRKHIMVGALTVRSGVIASLGVLVLADVSVWVIAPVLVVSSSLRGGFEPVAYAVVADVAEPEQRVAAFGLSRMGTNLGWAIGPALGGLLGTVLPYGVVFFCAAPALLLGAVLTSRIVDPIKPGRDGEEPRVSLREAAREALQRADVSVILGCAFVFALCHVQLFATLALYTSSELSLPNDDVGLMYMANGVAVLVLQIPAVALIARMGNERALISGALLYVCAFIGFGVAPSLIGIMAAVTVLSIGEVLLSPAQQAVVANLSDPKRLGRAFGLFGTMQMLGVAFAPLLGGTIYDHFRERGIVMWGILAALPLLLTIGYGVFAAIRASDHAQNEARSD